MKNLKFNWKTMYLFIDTISPKNALFLTDEKNQVIQEYFFDVRLQESSRLIEEVDQFLKSLGVDYMSLKKIAVVNWPWSFTGVRTSVLLANTMNYVIKWEMYALSYFDLFDSYPIVKSSSKRDVFLKKSSWSEIEIISNEDFISYVTSNNISQIYGDIGFELEIERISEVDYQKAVKKAFLSQAFQKIEPLYLKKPNIS